MPIYRATSAQITAWLATAAALRAAAQPALGGEAPVPPSAFSLVSPAPASGQPAAYTAGLVDTLINAGAQSVTLPGGYPNPTAWLLQVPPQISGLRIPITLSMEFAASFSPPAEAIAASFAPYATPLLACPNNSF
jgi:hypothetical protein